MGVQFRRHISILVFDGQVLYSEGFISTIPSINDEGLESGLGVVWVLRKNTIAQIVMAITAFSPIPG
jgi:hypothetical protein